MKAMNLRTEHLNNPIGIDIARPYLSWNCQDGIKQTAYEIEAFSKEISIWKSGKVQSDEMHTFLGAEAASKQCVTWKVRIWDEKGLEGEWSEPASFEMGILNSVEFAAKWINPELTCDPAVHKPASYRTCAALYNRTWFVRGVSEWTKSR